MRRAPQRLPKRHSRTRSLAGFALAATLAGAFYGGAAVATGPVVGGDEKAAPEQLLATSRTAGAVVDVQPKGESPAAPSDELAWPVRGGITGRFGEDRGGREHDGIDIPLPTGTPIRAASAGTVVMSEDQDGYGKYTCVAHVKVLTCYAHQSRFRVKQGARVRRGELIGHVGDTGSSSTPHLHFEVRKGRAPWGEPLDPLKYLPRR